MAKPEEKKTITLTEFSKYISWEDEANQGWNILSMPDTAPRRFMFLDKLIKEVDRDFNLIITLTPGEGLDKLIEEHLSEYAAKKARIDDTKAEVKSRMDALKDTLKELHTLRGEDWKDDKGRYVMVKTSKPTVKYDADALDALLKADPDKYGFLAQFRTEKPGGKTFAIKS